MDGRSMEARIARLERECRRWRLAGVVAVLGVVGVGAAQGPPGVIRARRLEVVDDRGRPRVALESSENLSGLYVLDAEGRERVTIGTFADGTRKVLLWAAPGEKHAALDLGATDENGATLGLTGPTGHRIYAGVGRSGPAMTMRDVGGCRIDAGIGVPGPIATMKGARGEVLSRAPAAGK